MVSALVPGSNYPGKRTGRQVAGALRCDLGDFTLTVSLPAQVYEWEPANLMTGAPGALCIFLGAWGCAAGTLKPLPYTKPCSADFATLY